MVIFSSNKKNTLKKNGKKCSQKIISHPHPLQKDNGLSLTAMYEYKLNVDIKRYYNLMKKTKKQPWVNWSASSVVKIHKEWFMKGLMIPMGTELNNVINN